MTWGEFKRRIEALGVTEDTPVAYIDTTGADLEDLSVEETPSGVGIG